MLALVAVNLLISADWVRDRVAKRIKEQTGRELKVNGTTALLFTPGPHIVITDATFSDPEARAGTADFSVGRLVIDLSLLELMSRQIDAERVVLERPVLTVRLGDDDRPKAKPKPTGEAKTPGEKRRRDVKLRDVRIEDGTVNIVYDDEGTEKRIEHIAANLSLPTLTAPFTGTGKLDWKEQTVAFNFTLTSLADLREKRPAKLVLARRYAGHRRAVRRQHADPAGLQRRGRAVGQGPFDPVVAGLDAGEAGRGDRASATASSPVTSPGTRARSPSAMCALRSNMRSGQGQAVVTLKSPRPHVRAALALDYLDLNPFLPAGRAKAAGAGGKPNEADPAEAAPRAESAVPRRAPANEASPPEDGQAQDWFNKPDDDQSAAPADRSRKRPRTRPRPARSTPRPRIGSGRCRAGAGRLARLLRRRRQSQCAQDPRRSSRDRAKLARPRLPRRRAERDAWRHGAL